MDQTLREMGIGDMGIPKHMRRMMNAFNGRMHNYLAAIAPERISEDIYTDIQKSTLTEVLKRNLYASSKDAPEDEVVHKMEQYIMSNIQKPLEHNISG